MNRMNQFFIAAGLALFLSACATPSGPKVDPDAKTSATELSQGPISSASASVTNNSAADTAIGSVSAGAKVTPPEPQIKPDQLLAEGIELYDKGDFKGAIRKLVVTRDSATSTPGVRQSSLKYLAFSYCVSGQKPLCKAQFANLLTITPDFQLGRGEAAHPLWGPVFKQAKTESTVAVLATTKTKK